MPGEGPMSAMNSSLKNNRALQRSRAKNERSTNYGGEMKPLSFTEPSAEKLGEIKAKIQRKAMQKTRTMLLSVIISLGILLLLSFLILL